MLLEGARMQTTSGEHRSSYSLKFLPWGTEPSTRHHPRQTVTRLWASPWSGHQAEQGCELRSCLHTSSSSKHREGRRASSLAESTSPAESAPEEAGAGESGLPVLACRLTPSSPRLPLVSTLHSARRTKGDLGIFSLGDVKPCPRGLPKPKAHSQQLAAKRTRKL